MNALRQSILNTVAEPNLALALVILGALLVYLEFTRPGRVLPGAAGSVLLLLGLKALGAFPLTPLALELIAFGLACLAWAALCSGHRALIGVGTAAFVTGAWKLVDGPIRFSTAATLGAPFALVTGFLLSTAVRARRNKTLDAQA